MSFTLPPPPPPPPLLPPSPSPSSPITRRAKVKRKSRLFFFFFPFWREEDHELMVIILGFVAWRLRSFGHGRWGFSSSLEGTLQCCKGEERRRGRGRGGSPVPRQTDHVCQQYLCCLFSSIYFISNSFLIILFHFLLLFFYYFLRNHFLLSRLCLISKAKCTYFQSFTSFIIFIEELSLSRLSFLIIRKSTIDKQLVVDVA